jgi:hypothetical protein
MFQFGALMRLIGVLDHQLVKPELSLDLAQQRRFGFVQTQPNNPTLLASKGADFLDRYIVTPLAVAVERAGNHARACSIGRDGKIKQISQKS